MYPLVKRHQQTKDRTYLFQGAKLHYSVIGSGKPVILLHGALLADPWNAFDKKLAKRYRVFLPHLPGFGASDTIPHRLHTTDLFAEAFADFIEQEKLHQLPVIAFSLGAVVAVKAVARRKLHNVMLLMGLPLGSDSIKLKKISTIPVWLRRLLGSTIWGRKHLVIPVLRDIVYDGTKERDEGLLKNLKTTDTKAIVDLDFSSEVGKIPDLARRLHSAHFIYGARDPLWRLADKTLPRITLIEEAEHNVFTSQPDKTLKIIEEILH